MLAKWFEPIAAFFTRVPWSAVLAAALVALVFNTYADISLKGPLGIGFQFEGWKPKAGRLQGTVNQFEQALKSATAAQQKVNADAELDYSNKAGKADHAHSDATALTDRATADFIAANRLPAGGLQCPADRSTAGAADPAAESGGAGVPEDMPADPFVAVRQSDVQRCSDLAPYAVGAHDWAKSLGLPAE